MVIVQESADQAKRFLGRVKSRMTSNRPYISDHGRPFYVPGQEKQGKPWAAHAIKLYDFDADEQDYSLEALGWTSQISGHRVDAMIIDDIQSRRSLNQTRKMVDILRQDFLSRLTTEAMCAIIATRVGVGDVYDILQKEDLINHLVILPAHNGVVTGCEMGTECTVPEFIHYEPLAPEMITPHRLAVKHKQAGPSGWANTWMQKPEDDGTMAFPHALVDAAYDDDLDIGELRPGGATILGLDPAITGNCVLTVGGYYPDRLDIIDQTIRSDLGSTEGIFQMVETAARRYKPQTLVIETNSWQKLFGNDVRLREMARVYGFRIEPNDTTKIKNDEVLGVATMANSLGRREMFFTGTEAGRRRLELLDHELKSWRPYVKSDVIKQDTVMSTWFIHRYWLQNRMRVAVHSDFTSPTCLPWTPTGMSPVPQSSEAAQFERHIREERERGLVRVTG